MWPREVCLGSPVLIWGILICNLLFVAAYVGIPYEIWRIHRSVGPRMPEPYLARVFKAFILTCALAHLSMAAVIFFLLFRFELAALMLGSGVALFAWQVLHRHRPAIVQGLRAYVAWRDDMERLTREAAARA